MSLNSNAIATAIAALSVSGISIKDITATPQQVQPRDCPILFPQPNGWATGGSAEASSNGPATLGTPQTRYWEFSRTYLYAYLHAPVGSGRGLVDQNPAMSTANDAITTALTTLDISTVDLEGVSVGRFDVIEYSGNQFHGFLLSIRFKERLNQ